MIEVADNGLGIPKHLISKVFNAMETDQKNDNYDGTGLGLNICK
jgi:K+-sensing histidine kinase KdpD